RGAARAVRDRPWVESGAFPRLQERRRRSRSRLCTYLPARLDCERSAMLFTAVTCFATRHPEMNRSGAERDAVRAARLPRSRATACRYTAGRRNGGTMRGRSWVRRIALGCALFALAGIAGAARAATSP